jgi:hypothetical protein
LGYDVAGICWPWFCVPAITTQSVVRLNEQR